MVKQIIVLMPGAVSEVASPVWLGAYNPSDREAVQPPNRQTAESDADAVYSLLLGRLADCSDASLLALNNMTAAEMKRRGLAIPRRRTKSQSAGSD